MTMKRLMLLSAMLCLGIPGTGYSLQGGPTMPEYVKFEPADITDIVNIGTGDFVYSVPLGDVPGPAGGFPITMSYHAGVGKDQEATIVGLGWTLNPGAINRMLRGFPDDIHNSATLSYVYAFDRQTGWGVNVGAGWGPVGLNMSYDTDKGFGGAVSLGAQYGAARVGVDIGTNGVGVSAQIGALEASLDKSGASVGVGYQGKSDIAAQASIGIHSTWSGKLSIVAGVGLCRNPPPGYGSRSTSLVGYSLNSANSSGGQVSIAGTGFSSMSSGGAVNVTVNQENYGATIPLPYGFWIRVGYNHYEQEVRISEANMAFMYGYMYQGGQAVKINNIAPIPGAALPLAGAGGGGAGSAGANSDYSNFLWADRGPSLENLDLADTDERPDAAELVKGGSNPRRWYWMAAPSYDVFTASGPGIAGSFRPFAKNSTSIYQVVEKLTSRDQVKSTLTYMLKPGQNWNEQSASVFPAPQGSSGLTDADFYFNPDVPYPDYPAEDYYFCEDGHIPFSRVKDNLPSVRAHFVSRNANAGGGDDCSPYAFLKSNIRNERNRLVISADDHERFRSSEHTNMRFGFIDELGDYDYYKFGDTVSQSYGGRQIIPLLEDDGHGSGQQAGRLKGFKIVDMDGKQYLYEKPVYSLFQVDYSTDQAQGMPSFAVGEEERFSWQTQITPYATQWLLTEVRGADFIKISETDMSKNYGYQIKLGYTDPVPYNWRSPYPKPNTASANLPNMGLPDKKRYIASMGQKELIYLESIESATHKANFNLNDPGPEERLDSREWKTPWFDNSGTAGNPPIDIPITMLFEPTSETATGQTNDDSWQQVSFGVNSIPGDPDASAKELYDYNVTYQCAQIYIPLSPTLSQLERLKTQGIDISGFNAAMTYYENITHIPPFYLRSDLEWVGAALQDPSTGYNTYQVADIRATVGAEERFGPYKIILSQPIVKNGQLRDLFPSTHPSHPGRTGRLWIGPKSYWEVGGQKYEMDARIPGCSKSDGDDCELYDVETNRYWTWASYATDFAPIPPRMNVIPWYQTAQGKNQARYLKSFDVVRKDSGKKLRSFEFAYDNSLCPGTPNSFVQPASPAIYPDKTSGLLGKLTLRKVTEKGYDLATGEASALPSYDFQYQGGSDFVTGGNPAFENWCFNIASSQCTSGAPTNQSTFDGPTGMLPFSLFRVDPYGMFNPHGTILNQKTHADTHQGVTWNLTKVTNPLGGELRIKYERDFRKDYDFHFYNGRKGEMFTSGRWEQEEFRLDGSGDIQIFPMSQSDVDVLFQTGKAMPYFGDFIKAEAEQRFAFTHPTYAVGDSLLIVFKGYFEYSTECLPLCEDKMHHNHDFFAASATVKTLVAGGALTLNLKPSEVSSQHGIYDEHNSGGGNAWQGGSAMGAVVYRLNQSAKVEVAAGDVRVKSLTSCAFDCNTTVYKYEDGSAATRPDSLMSMKWMRDMMFHPDGSRQTHIGSIVDKVGIGLGKNAMHTSGGEFDTPFLPSSSVQYGKVTVANINTFACDDYRPEIPGCITNGKTVYRFHTADAPIADGHAILEIGSEAKTRDGQPYTKLKYQDRSSIIGRMASVTYFGSQWNAGASPATTDFYLVSKDSTTYLFGKSVAEDWESEKRFGSGTGDFNLAQAEYDRYPVKVGSQLKYNFLKKVPGSESVQSAPYLMAKMVNDGWDKLTGNVISSYSEYKDGLNPSKTKQRFTLTQSMAELGRSPAGSGYALPKEMGRRNMLTQPFSEILQVKEGGIATMLGYKLSLWASTDNSNSLRNGVIYNSGDLAPTFPLPTPTVPGELGNPTSVYGSGYDLSRWTGSRIQRVDKYSHPLEAKMPNGTLVSSFYSEDGLDQSGYILNAPRQSSLSMVFNADPSGNPDWKYDNASQYKNGNFLLQRTGGGSTPLLSRRLPLAEFGNYQVTFRAKTRSANAILSVDFFSTYMKIVGFHLEPATFEGPQSDFTITPTWQTFTANLNVTSAVYNGFYEFPIRFGNALRFFMDNPASDGLASDVLVDFIRVETAALPPASVAFGDWKLNAFGSFLLSNKAAIYSSAAGKPSVLEAPLDLEAGGKDLYVVEFRARANQESVPLQVDFLGSGGAEGDQKQVILGTTWKKYAITLDRRAYASSGSYAANKLRFFSDTYENGEIEIDYARAYPQGALANTVAHDARGNATEMVDENHVSTSFSYDPFGRLIGVKNDSGFVLTEQKLNYGKN